MELKSCTEAMIYLLSLGRVATGTREAGRRAERGSTSKMDTELPVGVRQAFIIHDASDTFGHVLTNVANFLGTVFS